MRRWRPIGILVVVLLSRSAVAHAQLSLAPGPVHFGLRLGAFSEHVPIGDVSTGVLTYPRTAEELSYHFSWFPGAAFLHDVSAGVGPSWAPRAYCESD